jgi:hypothetical protein
MKLALDLELTEAIGRSDRVGASITAGTALELATAQIEGYIGTPLERAGRLDMFGNLRPISGSGDSAMYVLNLTAGFVDPDEDFEVFFSTEDNLQIEDVDTADLQTISKYGINHQTGRVTIFGDIPRGPHRNVGVRYTSGFAENDTGYAEGVPASLKVAAIAVAARNIRGMPLAVTNKLPFKDMQREIGSLAIAALQQFRRPRAIGAYPQSTSAV